MNSGIGPIRLWFVCLLMMLVLMVFNFVLLVFVSAHLSILVERGKVRESERHHWTSGSSRKEVLVLRDLRVFLGGLGFRLGLFFCERKEIKRGEKKEKIGWKIFVFISIHCNS